jgi:catechol 2,3-dioxygenase-like lactoylglutathione lyase family enzyme
MFRLDHVIVGVRDFRRAVTDWEKLGLIATDGGTHPEIGTRNALVRFPDGSFLELMAIEDRERLSANAPVLLEQLEGSFDGPFSWALRTDDIEGARATLAAEGFEVLSIWRGEGKRDSGRVARWRTLHIREAGFPFLVQYETEPTSEPSPDAMPVNGLGAVLLSGPMMLLTRLSRAFHARRAGSHVYFDGGRASIVGTGPGDPAIVGVQLLAIDANEVERTLGAVIGETKAAEVDPRLHGLTIHVSASPG